MIRRLAKLHRKITILLARKRLERLVIKQREHNRNYSKKRQAAKLGWQRRLAR